MNPQIAFTLCVLVCLSQSINGETIEDVLADLKPDVKSLQISISQVIRNSRHEIGLTRAAIGEAVDQGNQEFDNHFLQTSNAVQELKDQAESAGKNIDQCLKTANDELDGIETRPLEKCNNIPELNLAGVKLGNLGELKDILGGAIDLCQEKNPSVPSNLRTCIEKEISSIKGQVDVIQGEILKTCEESKKASNACIDKVSTEVDSILDNLLKQFENCVAM